MEKKSIDNPVHCRRNGMAKCLSFVLFFIVAAFRFGAAFIQHDSSYYSGILQRDAKYVVVLPADFEVKKAAGHRYPVLYLLHCAGCNRSSFLQDYYLSEFVDSVDMIVAMPGDGTSGGWWLDSPVNPLSHLSTWLSGEFKNRIDSLYPTYADRKNTGVAGHSMGGFGALHNLLTHPNVYGAAFSAKGLLDMVGHEGSYMASTVLGPFASNSQFYHAVDILENAGKFAGINAGIRFYSGPNDWFQTENRAFDSLLTKHNVPHTYFENGEQHYPMSPESTRDMLAWFDSLFTRGSNGTPVTTAGSALHRAVNRGHLFHGGINTLFLGNFEKFFRLDGTIAEEGAGNGMPAGMVIGIPRSIRQD